MKLIIQIPCLNEEAMLATTLSSLPRELPGIDVVEWLVIDDGSIDRTVDVAWECGVDHIVKMGTNRGLAAAFSCGLKECLRLGADIIINTDADNQYEAGGMAGLIEPILASRAEIVIGTRPISSMDQFSWLKKKLQRAGSLFVRKLSGLHVPDAPSGFRAMSKSAAMNINVFGDYTYTLEMLIQAGYRGINVVSVPVKVAGESRPSRLANSMIGYIWCAGLSAFRIFVVYYPFRFFGWIGTFVFLSGVAIGFRFLYFYFSGDGQGHVQSVILSALLVISGLLLFVVGLLADLVSVNRRLLEEVKLKLDRDIDAPN